jgi:hypothetical protein
LRRETVFTVLLAACGGDDGGGGAPDARPASDAGVDARGGIFVERPECQGASLTPLMGQHPMVVSKIAIGTQTDAFDLDGDGFRDNKLAGLGPLAAMPIEQAFERLDFVVPLELADFATVAADDCVKLGFYLGRYKIDRDGDGRTVAAAGGDCDDHVMSSRPGATELAGNGKDDDCDGAADEDAPDTMDRDRDGKTTAGGDCDDTSAAVGGQAEVCGDGLDNDCSGVADHPGCSPYDDTPDTVPVESISLEGGRPKVYFHAARAVAAGGAVRLEAGPAYFAVTVPVTGALSLELRISGTQLEAELRQGPGGPGLVKGRLGGVLDAATLDEIRGLTVPDLLTPEDSLLDVMFTSGLGSLLALPRHASGCLSPDIDVDGDGREAFCDADPNDAVFRVDRCIDGDGTEVRDAPGVHCTEARRPGGALRFVDGVSVALTFEAVAAARLVLAP